MDHFYPVASGGAHQPYNWVPAFAWGCNTEKSDAFPWEFDPERFQSGDRDPGELPVSRLTPD